MPNLGDLVNVNFSIKIRPFYHFLPDYFIPVIEKIFSIQVISNRIFYKLDSLVRIPIFN